MARFQRFSEAVNTLVKKCLFFLGAVICLILFAQVLFRYAGSSLGWSEEVSRYLLVAITFLGGSVAYKQASFIGLTGFGHRLGPTFQKIVIVLLQGLTLVCFILITWFGTTYTIKAWEQSWSSLPLPMSLPFAVIPLGAAIFIVHVLADIFKAVEGTKP